MQKNLRYDRATVAIAVIALVIAFMTWLLPFDPVGPSPLAPKPTSNPHTVISTLEGTAIIFQEELRDNLSRSDVGEVHPVIVKRTQLAEIVYSEILREKEVIVGSAWGFDTTMGGCVAFMIIGPGQFDFKVNDGVWEQYLNISATQAELLLERHVEILHKEYSCVRNAIKVVIRR
jgi:hypothetical protein